MTNVFEECVRIAKDYNPKHTQKNGYRHFSFVIQENKILDWDINKDGSCLYGYKPYQKVHSENSAYFKAKTFINKKKQFEIINIRLNKKGYLKMSAPCECCVIWLKKMNCRAVHFSISEDMPFAKIYL